jgi:DNA-binding transcriptional MerR regulator
MPITISGKTYFRTIEVCRMVGLSRNTLFRWLREGTFADVESVDRRGWRLFTEDDINRLKVEANRVRHNTLRASKEIRRPAD